MAFSFTDRIGDGVTTSYSFGFIGPGDGYIDEDHVKVYVEDANGDLQEVTFSFTGPNTVELDEAPALDALIRIRREVPDNQPYSDFTRGNAFGQKNVNNSFKQNLYLMHEYMDGFKVDDYYEKQDLNMGAKKVINAADGEVNTDLATLGQVYGLIDLLKDIEGPKVARLPSLVELKLIDTTDVSESQLVYVVEEESIFKFVNEPTRFDEIFRVEPGVGPGHWLRWSGKIVQERGTYGPVWAETSHPQSEAVTEIRIPGDMATITEAVEYCSRFSINLETSVDIYLQTGFVMQEQVYVSSQNLGWLTIYAEDPEVVIDGDYLIFNRTQAIYGVITRAAFTCVQGGQHPRIGCPFRMINGGVMYDKPTGRKMGLFVSGPNSGCNVMNFRGFKDCGDAGIYANRGAYINCYGSDVSGSGVGVYVNRATVDAQNVVATDCVTDGILALYGSTVTAVGADVSRSVNGVRAQFGSFIIFREGIALDVEGYAISASNNSRIEAEEANATGAIGALGRGVYAHSGSTISFANGIADNCQQYGVHADSAATIDAYNVSALNCGEAGIRASSGSSINAFAAQVSSATGRGIEVLYGSNVAASSAVAVGNGVYAQHNSSVYFLAGTATGVAGKPALEAQNCSTISANGSDVSGSETGVYANSNSKIDFTNANASGCTDTGIYAKSGSTITAPLADATGNLGVAGSAVYAEQASTIDFASGSADNSAHYGIRANTGSVVNCSNATAEGCTTNGLRVDSGCHVNASFGKFRKAVGVDDPADMSILGGSIVNGASAEGGSNLPNRVLSLGGILFRL